MREPGDLDFDRTADFEQTGQASDRVRTSPGIGAALAVGILVSLGAFVLFGSPDDALVRAPSDDANANESASTTPEASSVLEDLAGESSLAGFQLLGSAGSSDLRLSFLRLPFTRGTERDDPLFGLVDGSLTTQDLEQPISGLGRIDNGLENPGEIRDYLLSNDAGTVLTNDGQATWYRPGQPAVPLGDGFSALPGPTTTSVWLLGSGEKTVRLVELTDDASPEDAPTFDLSEFGRPIDSAAGGLVLGLKGRGEDEDFAFWSPSTGKTSFVGTTSLSYLGAGGTRVVFFGGAVAVVLDTADPAATGRVVALPGDAIFRTAVSTDGRYLAASIVTPLTELNWISIVDLRTGDEVDSIRSSIEIAFRWSRPDALLYLRPDWPAVTLAERDISSGVDRNLVHFDDLSWWFSASEQR